MVKAVGFIALSGVAVLNGPVDGGLGNDTLDFSAYGTPVSVSPSGTVIGSGDVSATPDPIAYATGNDYTGITLIQEGTVSVMPE